MRGVVRIKGGLPLPGEGVGAVRRDCEWVLGLVSPADHHVGYAAASVLVHITATC
jgi:hypothetical protein